MVKVRDSRLIFKGRFNFVRGSVKGSIIPLINRDPIRLSAVYPVNDKRRGKDPGGLYQLNVKHGQSVICDIRVEIHMALTKTCKESFLAFISSSSELFSCLAPYQGKDMEIAFTPIVFISLEALRRNADRTLPASHRLL